MCFSAVVFFSLLLTTVYAEIEKSSQCKSKIKSLVKKLHERLDTIEKDAVAICGLKDGQNNYHKLGESSGTVYTRWGRTKCPKNDTETVYTGFVAGSNYRAGKGSAANYLCLPKIPGWGKYKDGFQAYSEKIYATEFEVTDRNSDGETFDPKNHDQDATCAVCQSKTRSNVLMIPGKTKCFDGWHREYRGYLMAQHFSHSPSEYICVDAHPEFAHGGSGSQNNRLLYPVEAVCGGAMKCPPYVNGREMPCVVCTK